MIAHMVKKTDSFFVRGTVATEGTAAWWTEEIDLGAFVDALGEHVLRIFNISVRYQDGDGNGPPVPNGITGSGGQAYITWALTTQPLASTTAVFNLSDKSLVASGTLGWLANGDVISASVDYCAITERYDIAPQDWTNGYLIGVDTLYLHIYHDDDMGPDDNRISICMECQSEKLSKASAMALALSQS